MLVKEIVLCRDYYGCGCTEKYLGNFIFDDNEYDISRLVTQIT